MIPNHIAPSLSELDLQIGSLVPPGGNWKNIPVHVPSQRLRQIRESYGRGEGSRSTYYGRLRPDAPAYTISTYFTRPGNGCHLHYEVMQNRTVSYREAARLQSFPDSFVFSGPNTAVAKQIGNAVPPLLAFTIANGFQLPAGHVVDLFAGAGGLSLGFHWAGWKGLVSSDFDEHALGTFSQNIHKTVVLGDIKLKSVAEEVVKRAQLARSNVSSVPLIVLGGPPCQGFSTAGNRRTRSDERNTLFIEYCKIVSELEPDAFVFENVPGLLNMEGGAVFHEVKSELERHCDRVTVVHIAAHEHGVPQRRKRILIIGLNGQTKFMLPAGSLQGGLLGGSPITASEALSDLPEIRAGQDGTGLPYNSDPTSEYQAFMRGRIDAQHFRDSLHKRQDGVCLTSVSDAIV